jgi:hypothetical protein
MADDTDVLLKMYDEQWTQARHIEDQRATITNIVVVIASAILGFIVQQGLSIEILPVTILLVVLGVYGAISSEKLYERFQFCVNRATVLRKRVDELHPNIKLVQLNKDFEAQHKKDYPRLSKVRLHYLWFFLHLAIALGGLILTVIVLF